MVFALEDLLPIDGICGAQETAPPVGADKNAVAEGHRQGRIDIGLAFPCDSIGGGAGHAGADSHEPVPCPYDRIEVLAFLADLVPAPGQPVPAAHPQAVEADSDEYAASG